VSTHQLVSPALAAAAAAVDEEAEEATTPLQQEDLQQAQKEQEQAQQVGVICQLLILVRVKAVINTSAISVVPPKNFIKKHGRKTIKVRNKIWIRI
jgi:hypothetical protein